MQNTENSCKNFVGLLSLVELITYSYLHQERVLSLWLEGKSEVNESVISHWAKGRIYLNYFQILITVALHTLRHEFSWQPHSFTHHAFAAQVLFFLEIVTTKSSSYIETTSSMIRYCYKLWVITAKGIIYFMWKVWNVIYEYNADHH